MILIIFMKLRYIQIYLLPQVWNEIIADNNTIQENWEEKFIHMAVNAGKLWCDVMWCNV